MEMYQRFSFPGNECSQLINCITPQNCSEPFFLSRLLFIILLKFSSSFQNPSELPPASPHQQLILLFTHQSVVFVFHFQPLHCIRSYTSDFCDAITFTWKITNKKNYFWNIFIVCDFSTEITKMALTVRHNSKSGFCLNKGTFLEKISIFLINFTPEL